MNLNELLQYTENVKLHINSLKFSNDDVRHSFFALYYSGIYDFYIGKVSYELSSQIEQENVLFTKNVIHLRPHINRIYEIAKNSILTQGYQTMLNRGVIFGTWTSFELCISLIFNYLIDESQYEIIIKDLNAKLLKAISSLEEDSKEMIVEVLKKSSFIPLKRKFNFIYSQNKSAYQRDIRQDRKLIELYSTIRNSMIHSNGLYHGKEITYQFEDSKFSFRNNEIFVQEGGSVFSLFNLSRELNEIFKSLIKCIEGIDFIPYPDDEINNT